MEIFILALTLGVLAMAKKRGKRRRKFNLRKVRINAGVAVGALDTIDVTSGAIHPAPVNPLRVTSLNASYSWSNIGAAIDDGLEFGVAHSDYSAAEIEECLEASASIDQGDKIAQEQADRLVRTIGIMPSSGTTGSGRTFNDGRRIRTKLNWLLGIGDTLVVWMRNGSGTIYTTGSSLVVSGDMWVKD